ncbi:MAG: hypothetical protein JSS66_00250 [Armatimonadetes bacterium]|nr:hypothetical protein [Armatimonadota bacterium]
MLLWNLDTDEVTPGQWVTSRVHTDWCDVSPNGRYLVSLLADYSDRHARKVERNHGLSDRWAVTNWTTISRPPYFTALAVWFGGSYAGGGGWWDDDETLRFYGFSREWKEVRPAGRIRVKPDGFFGVPDPIGQRLERKGWLPYSRFQAQVSAPGMSLLEAAKELYAIASGDARDRREAIGRLLVRSIIPKLEMLKPGALEKSFSGGAVHYVKVVTKRNMWPVFESSWRIVDTEGDIVREWRDKSARPQFLEVDHRGRVVFGDEGCLWAWEDCPKGKPKLVADLRENRFSNVPPPPWALEW